MYIITATTIYSYFTAEEIIHKTQVIMDHLKDRSPKSFAVGTYALSSFTSLVSSTSRHSLHVFNTHSVAAQYQQEDQASNKSISSTTRYFHVGLCGKHYLFRENLQLTSPAWQNLHCCNDSHSRHALLYLEQT